jgi:hypothetical protein
MMSKKWMNIGVLSDPYPWKVVFILKLHMLQKGCHFGQQQSQLLKAPELASVFPRMWLWELMNSLLHYESESLWIVLCISVQKLFINLIDDKDFGVILGIMFFID